MDPSVLENPSVKVQLDVRNNSTVLEDYARELNAWEKEMKERDKLLQKTSTEQKPDVPPPRSKRVKSPKPVLKKSSTDYDKWDKFDVEKACKEVDESTTESSDDEQAIEKSKELKNEGNNFVKKCNWSKALECYTKAIQLYQGDAIYFANRALCYLKLEKWTKAEKDCNIALEIDPKYVKALQRRSVARAALGKLIPAKNDMCEVINLEPNNKEAKEHLQQLNNKITDVENKEKKVESISKKVDKPSKTLESKDQKNYKSSKNTLKETKLDSLPKWFTESDKGRFLIKPVFKAPHERSKKPLRRITVEELDTTKPAKRSINTLKNVQTTADMEIKQTSIVLTPCTTFTSCSNLDKINNSDAMNNQSKIIELNTDGNVQENKQDNLVYSTSLSVNNNVKLEEPKTSIHFYNTWKLLKGDQEKRYEFLKMVPGKNFKKLFGSSLESNIVSEILEILEMKFVLNNMPVFSYLEGLSSVGRFNALKMFMSEKDKTAIKNLICHAERLQEISPNEVKHMITIYEINL